MLMRIIKSTGFCLLLVAGVLHAQELRNPFDFPILLSGNFGELRGNHFHSGIDFKTQQVEGKPVHAVEAGYISRIVVSPWGYGNVLYLTHPGGITTVYGHLQRFAKDIAEYVKEQQYAKEDFSVDLTLQPEQFPVEKGQLIALAGNSGGSVGPHLHFEVRNTVTDEAVDPLEYYKDRIKDTRPPKIEGFMIYPTDGRGVVNGSSRKQELKLITNKNGRQVLTGGKVEAWGEIGVAIKAYDYMDGTSNIYGVRRIAMAVDDSAVFSSNIDCFSIGNETRYINSFTDYEEWRLHRSFYMKSFVEPGNRLNFVKSINRGIIHINEERTYRISYRLRDIYGNLTQYTLRIDGKKQPILSPDTLGTEYFHWRSENRFGAKGIRLTIPNGNLYDDLYFHYYVNENAGSLSATHTLHNRFIALHDKALLSLHLQTDTLEDKKKYGIVRMQNARLTWIGGTYRSGWLDADIRELGTYTLMQDLKPPSITPVNPAKWLANECISFRISDNLSGVETYRGEIDGNYVLFELDGKKGLASYHFDNTRLEKGPHKLTFIVTDACGNQSTYDYSWK
ncbi:peptidase M23 [Bacteroidia bacterium]|nr:peptidase M23 [Bacteroidia bacterium]